MQNYVTYCYAVCYCVVIFVSLITTQFNMNQNPNQINFEVVIAADRIRQLIHDEFVLSLAQEPQPQSDTLLTLRQCQDFLEEKAGRRLARQTIYGLVNERKIPFQKFGKYLYFSKSEISQWLANGRQIKK